MEDWDFIFINNAKAIVNVAFHNVEATAEVEIADSSTSSSIHSLATTGPTELAKAQAGFFCRLCH